ncbi:MAG: endonuclease domain-containing protein [Acidimicrobiales bacterium]
MRQDLMIGVLDAGPDAVVSHHAAAALWRLPGFGFGPVEVSVARGRAAPTDTWARLHRPSVLGRVHVTERVGIPVTTLPRTLFDLAASIHPLRLERVVDGVVAKCPGLLVPLHALLEELGTNGREGAASMRSVLAARPLGYVAPASGLEARFEQILAEAGEPPLERQVDVGGHAWIGRVDYFDRPLRIIFELDSELHHSSPLDRAHDERRDEELRAAGWRYIVRIFDGEVWRRPQLALGKVRTARAQARSDLLAAESDRWWSNVAARSR